LPEAGDGECPLRVSKGGADYLEIKDEKVIEKRESKTKKRGRDLKKSVYKYSFNGLTKSVNLRMTGKKFSKKRGANIEISF